MIAQIIGAVTRGALVALLIAMPSLLIGGVTADTAHVITLISFFLGALVMLEYGGAYPSIIEFRYAAPYNRIVFSFMLICVFSLGSMYRHASDPTALTGILTILGGVIGKTMDFQFSPVQLIVASLPSDTPLVIVGKMRTAAGTSYFLALMMIVTLLLTMRLSGWPQRRGVFNVWINLPLFEPTGGGDVVPRLQRDARYNIVLGALFPFLIPALVRMTTDLFLPLDYSEPQTMIWAITLWAFFPAVLVMRGLAMLRIAEMIDEKRRRSVTRQGAQPA